MGEDYYSNVLYRNSENPFGFPRKEDTFKEIAYMMYLKSREDLD
jgi:hypothetical protein